jgi:hypothetical protein
MLRLGFDVLSMDGSAAIAKQAEARISRPVLVQRFDQLDAVAEFDTIWASASLLHVPTASLPDILGRIHIALRPTGCFLPATNQAAQQAGIRLAAISTTCLWTMLLRAYERSANWKIRGVSEYTGGGFDGGAQGPWISIIAAKS